jgi:hypothetical protein
MNRSLLPRTMPQILVLFPSTWTIKLTTILTECLFFGGGAPSSVKDIGAPPTTARRAKRENGGLGEDPPGSPIGLASFGPSSPSHG